MNELIGDNELIPVILVGLRTTEREDEFDHAMNELVALCEACDLEVLASMTQKLEHPDNATWIGSGKAQELAEEVRVNDAEHVVCLGNLSPAQMKNLQKIIKVPVWDRTNLILEIFSRRARTREARLQVESAYLQYMLPRLTGMWQHLGRQSGGGGSRANKGVGEKQIELDRRQISHRITELKKELAEVEHTRDVQRNGRKRDGYPHVALVGYTNAGKSTLMNCLIGMTGKSSEKAEEKKVFEKDMLFATLDTTVRKVVVDNLPFLLSDTVGFIRKLPTDLVESFKSTLDEVREADLLIHVVDISHPDFEDQMKVVDKTLADLGAAEKPVIVLFNKIDAYTWVEKEADDLTPATRENVTLDELERTWMGRLNGECLFVSALKKTGIENMRKVLYDRVKQLHVQKYPYNDFLYPDLDNNQNTDDNGKF